MARSWTRCWSTACMRSTGFDSVFHLAARAPEGLSHFVRRFNNSNHRGCMPPARGHRLGMTHAGHDA